MMLDVEKVALLLIAELVRPVEKLKRRDRHLADQVDRALNSIGLNPSEGGGRDGKDRTHFRKIAFASTSELRMALAMAVVKRHLCDEELVTARELLDRVRAMLWRMIHPRPRA